MLYTQKHSSFHVENQILLWTWGAQLCRSTSGDPPHQLLPQLWHTKPYMGISLYKIQTYPPQYFLGFIDSAELEIAKLFRI